MPIAPRATSSTIPKPYVVPASQEFDGNDGSWSTFKISVGTPGQDFRVLPSTKSGETYVIVPEGCIEGIDGPNCSNLRGAEVFQSSQSPGFQVNMSSSWSTIGQYSVDLEERLNYTGQGLFGFDTVSLGSAADKSSLSLDHQVVAGVADLDYYMGNLALGTPDSSFSSLSQSIDSFLFQLRNSTKIPSLSFSYTAGAKYRLKSVFGSLILGGYDSTRFTPSTNPFSFSFATDPSRLLTVGVESIMALNSLQGTYSLSSGAHFSLIDSTVPHLWLPRTICDNFEKAFGLTYDPVTDFYLVNDTMHEKLQSLNPSITIKLVNSLEDTSTNYTNIILPYAAFDLQASYPHYQNATNYFPIRRAANDTQYVLGRTLLQEAYLIVDYERANFTIAQAAFPDPLPAAKVVTIEPPSTSSTSKSSSASLGIGAIAGIAAAGGILLLLVLIGAFIVYRKRRVGRKRKYELANTQISETGSGANISSAQKYQDPQELGGTPLTELASPRHEYSDRDQKTFTSPTNVPQELPTPMTLAPAQQRWREVTSYHEMDGSAPPSRNGSRAPSEDGTRRYSEYPPSSGISPLTGRF
ncbi:acid protease [Melanomma pulvis-pyrius CBS 109.77]|uniref:Acid protease n=1 Tax=Melanomma pulvis-pyrius CBS 109.77 TaxID=1314802 RepID=A0A6A6XT51_9PLEO|nr:acid protease [Melanomma pulvis-pyrius CBS 109.77]